MLVVLRVGIKAAAAPHLPTPDALLSTNVDVDVDVDVDIDVVSRVREAWSGKRLS